MIRILFGRFEVGAPETVVCLKMRETDKVKNSADLLSALDRSISEWINTYDPDVEVDDFNIGDLGSELGDDSLRYCLEQNGIHNLDIVDFDEVCYYDKILQSGAER